MARLTLAGGKLDEYGDKLPFARLFNGEVIEGLEVVPTVPASTTVTVRPGSGFFRDGATSGRWAYPFVLDTPAGENITAPTAQPQPMIVDIVAALDKTAISSTNLNNEGSWALYAVSGTPNASPAAPSDAQVQAAIGGASKPFVRLGRFTHNASTQASGVTVIEDIKVRVMPMMSRKILAHVGVSTKVTLNTVIHTAFTTYVTMSGNTSGGEVVIDFSADLRDSGSGATRTGALRVQIDGITVVGSQISYYTPNALKDTPSLKIQVPLAAGKHTFTLQFSADTASATYLNQASISVSEVIGGVA